MEKKFSQSIFEKLYDQMRNTKVTFSEEMGEQINKELDKMVRQREEWLRNKKDGGN